MKWSEGIEVHIGKELRGEVTNGKAAARGGTHQGLVAGQVVPSLGWTLEARIGQWIVKQDGADQKFAEVTVRDALLAGLCEAAHHQSMQDGAVDGHEEALDIESKHPAVLAVVVAGGPQKPLGATDAKKCPLSLATTVGVADELSLEDGCDPVVKQVVHHTVAEIGGHDLALDGNRTDEAGGGQELIASFPQDLLKVE